MNDRITQHYRAMVEKYSRLGKSAEWLKSYARGFNNPSFKQQEK